MLRRTPSTCTFRCAAGLRQHSEGLNHQCVWLSHARASRRCRRSRSAARCQQIEVRPEVAPMEHSNGKSKHARLPDIPTKSEVMVVRTDGMSCSRELVEASGCLSFAHPSSQQQLLVWKQRPKSVLVLKKLGGELLEEFINVIKFLHDEEGLNVIVEQHMHEELATRPDLDYLLTFSEDQTDMLRYFTDFVLCLGGDGVILHASSLFQTAHPPVLAFNMGSLGFLTNHLYRSYKQDVRNLINGAESLGQCQLPDENLLGSHITLRMRLECKIKRRGDSHPQPPVEVLNEIVIDRGANPYLTKIECWERDCLITKVQADGVLLATPTGSTAYSVAAGGSMVHPNVPAILFTPICPHSLSFKPVILPDYAEVELRVPEDARCGAWVCFDGKRRQELFRGDSVAVRMSTNPLPTVSRTDQTRDWFASLERCFSWNDRMEQKSFDN